MLTADKICFSVKNKSILKEVQFEVQPGEFLAVIGPNGAGKSTLLKILCGELRDYSGKVILEDQELTKIKPKHLAVKRAVLSQSISLTLPYKVSEVVMMGRYPHFDSIPSSIDRLIVEESLELTGMAAFRERNYLTLSGGEKQRVHMARVLAQLNNKGNKSNQDSKILFLDEPVNGLDLKYQQQVMKIAREWIGEKNVVIAVLHDLNLAAHYADKVLLLNQGHQESMDVPEKVLTKEIIKKVYDIDVRIVTEHETNKAFISPVFQSESGQKDLISILV